MDVRFDCTQCGKCCHDLRLPLSVEEALLWAGRGHQVDLLCDALPMLSATPPAGLAERYRFDRSFPAISGTLDIMVNVILVASHRGPCPHLKPDMLCGNYEARPRVCRIYPAEIVPHIALSPDAKACPSEAWNDDQPIFLQNGTVVSDETRRLIEAHREATLVDVPIKAAAASLLGDTKAALGNEGYSVYSPPPQTLVDILGRARMIGNGEVPNREWTIMTNRSDTLAMLSDAGAASQLTTSSDAYIGFFNDVA